MSEPYISVKWPNLLVVGEPVTREQAAAILIRTRPTYLFTNVRDAEANYNKILDRLAPEPLDLEYLDNTRIASSWIDGVKGWCDWNGHIGCSNYNIGKWPSVEEVTDDLRKIAEAFPFLRMIVQVLDRESCEEGGTPTAEWRIRDGQVTLVAPMLILVRDPHTSYVSPELAEFRQQFKDDWRSIELGVTYKELAEACRHV